MANFSVNQVRQFYVVKDYDVDQKMTTEDSGELEAGTITSFMKDAAGLNLYFMYKGADGSITRSDLIPVKNIISVRGIKKTDPSQKPKAKVVELSLNTAINEGKPVSGQDYIVRVVIKKFVGMSDKDINVNFGAVHASSMKYAEEPGKFYFDLAQSLYKNFKRQLSKLFKFSVMDADDRWYEVTDKVTYDDLGSNDLVKIKIEPIPQTAEYITGIKALEPVDYDVFVAPIVYEGEETINWVDDVENSLMGTLRPQNGVGNGYAVADMEYFYHGERGDQYRGINWPNIIPTKYLADPTKSYDLIEIHYAYTGSNENVQMSEKDITLAIEKDTVAGAVYSFLTGYADIKNENPFY